MEMFVPAAEMLVVALAAMFFGLLVYRRWERVLEERSRNRAVAEKILDRFATTEEMIAFVRSEEGLRLLGGAQADPRRTVMRFVQSGVVVCSLGIAFLINAWRLGGLTDINDIRKVAELRYWGSAAVAVGIGLVVAGMLSHALARRWNLLERTGSR